MTIKPSTELRNGLQSEYSKQKIRCYVSTDVEIRFVENVLNRTEREENVHVLRVTRNRSVNRGLESRVM